VIPVLEGVAFLDMNEVVKAFAAGQTILSPSLVTILPVANGGTSRNIVRGNDYVMTPVYSTSTVTTQMVVINVKLRKISHYVPIPGAMRWLWVPIQTSEPIAQIAALRSQVAALTLHTDSTHSHEDDLLAKGAIIVGSIAFVLVIMTIITLLCMCCTGGLTRKGSSEMEYLKQPSTSQM
jgi:hypothetical protein